MKCSTVCSRDLNIKLELNRVKKLLESFEMWSMVKISWTEKMTDKEVLVRSKEARSILKMIRHRKHRWLGQVLRHENFLHDIVEGKMMVKANEDRKRMV